MTETTKLTYIKKETDKSPKQKHELKKPVKIKTEQKQSEVKFWRQKPSLNLTLYHQMQALVRKVFVKGIEALANVLGIRLNK